MMNSSFLFNAAAALVVVAMLALSPTLAGDALGTAGRTAAAIAAIAAALFGLWNLARLAQALRQVCDTLERLTTGEFEARIHRPRRHGLVGCLQRNLNRFADVADAFLRETEWTTACMADGRLYRRIVERGLPGHFNTVVRRVNRAVDEAFHRVGQRTSSALRMADTVEQEAGVVMVDICALTGEVSEAAQRMHSVSCRTSESATSAASAACQVTSGAETVAAATQELHASIAEIGRQVSGTRDIAHRAVVSTEQANTMMASLSQFIADIGAVVDMITQIAQQTNMLAMNATIEAARAGEAGKGFAVVAGEVKYLANQTAGATKRITEQIGAICTAASQSMDAISQVYGIISEVENGTAAIAAAIEEQSAATNEIARAVNDTASAANQVSLLMAELSDEARISRDLSEEVQKDNVRVTETVSGLRGTLARIIRTSTAEVDRRAGQRYGVFLPVEMDFGQTRRQGTLTNLSAGGACVTVEGGMAGGADGSLVVYLPEDCGDRAARVASARGPALNLAFDVPLEAERVARLAHAGGLALLAKARSDHQAFVANVMSVLDGGGQQKAADLANHHTCRLGKWYDGVSDQRIRACPAFAALVEPHRAVHDGGKRALAAFWAGDAAAATAAAEEMAAASHQVVALLAQLEQQVAQGVE